MSDIIYTVEDRLYINLTNRCTNRCSFCIKFLQRHFQNRYNLFLGKEPTVEEVLAQVPDTELYSEIVFCGYGEPLLRLDAVKEIARSLKEDDANVRVDTDGLANLFYKRNVLSELQGLVDSINVSLNAPDAKTYEQLCRPSLGPNPYDAVLSFIREAKNLIPKVTASVVDLPKLDLEGCRIKAKELGVPLVIRPFYSDTYVEKRAPA